MGRVTGRIHYSLKYAWRERSGKFGYNFSNSKSGEFWLTQNMGRSVINKTILLVEQAILSLNNFLLILLLSSLMVPTEFKNWAILNIIIFLGIGLNNVIVNQPYQVFINKYYKKYLYKDYLFVKYILIGVISCIVAIISLFIIDENLVNNYFITITIILLFSLFELQRRILIHNKENIFLLSITFFFVFSNNTLLFILLHYYSLNYIQAYFVNFIILMIVLFISSYKIHNIYNLDTGSIQHFSKKLFITSLKRHYFFSKTLILGMFFYWVYTQGFLLWIETQLTINEFNSLRIILNIINISSILLLVFDNYYITRQSFLFKSDKNKFYTQFTKLSIYFIIIYILYMIFFMLVAWLLFDNIYPTFQKYEYFLLPLFIAQLIYGISRPLILLAKVSEQNYLILYAHIIAAIIIVIFGKIFSIIFGINGMVIAIILSYIGFTVTIFVEYILLKRK